MYASHHDNPRILFQRFILGVGLLLPLLARTQVVTEGSLNTTGRQPENEVPVPEVTYSDSARALIKVWQLNHSHPTGSTSRIPYIGNQQQVSNCPNSNFSSGTYANWNGEWGMWGLNGNTSYPNEFDTNTVAPLPHGHAQCYQSQIPSHCPPLHHIIAAPGTWDPLTGDSLITVFPGESYSSRLGHNIGGYHYTQLSYQVTVTTSTYLFMYRFAVVLQLPVPKHPPADQPNFKIQVVDSTGALIDSCGYYQVRSPDQITDSMPPTWHKHLPGAIVWKEWTTVGISLANYIGHTVTIKFEVKDCGQGAHFGYAYLSTFCDYINIQTSMCEHDTIATLTAPPGFRYLWNTGDTTQSITIPYPTPGASYNCVLTAVNGCQVTITQVLTSTVLHANFTYVPACPGDGTHFYDSSYLNQNTVNGWRWFFGDGTPEVDGIQNPVHTFDTTGDYHVTLIAYSTEGCPDTITKLVHIESSSMITNTSLTKTICSRDNTNIHLESGASFTTFTWVASSKYGTTTGYSPGSGDSIRQVLTNTGRHTDTVFYDVTPHGGVCVGLTERFRMAVRPLPAPVSTSMVKSICDSTMTGLYVTPFTDSTAFTWTCTASSAALSGYSNNVSNPDTLINQLLWNSGVATDTVYYHLLPETHGCQGDPFTYSVAVYPEFTVTFTPPAQMVCSGLSTSIQLSANGPGPVFNWTATGAPATVSGYSPGTGNLIQQTLFNSGLTPGWVIYSVSLQVNGCTGKPGSMQTAVHPNPMVTLTPCFDTITTVDAKPITLRGGIPLSGTFSGPGVNSATSMFYPSIAGAGTNIITYSYTNSLLCTASKFLSIHNLPHSNFTCGSNLADIRDNKTYATVKIGIQCWMAEDLNFGTNIPFSQYQRDNCIPEKYPNPSSILYPQSSVYQWDELMQYDETPADQGLCPPAWHIPTDNEWNTLFAHYTNNAFAGGSLKYSGYSGFNALLTGTNHENRTWDWTGFAGFFWSSTSHNTDKALAHGLNEINPSVSLYPSLRSNAFGVRCLKD